MSGARQHISWRGRVLWLFTIVVATFFAITLLKLGHACVEWLEGVL